MNDTGQISRIQPHEADTQIADSILQRSLGVSVMIVAVKAFALGKEMIVAYYFGTSGVLDAYLIAFLLPSLAVNVFGASFQSALIPALIGSSKSGAAEAVSAFASRVFSRYVLVLILLTGILAVVTPVFLKFVGHGGSIVGANGGIGLAFFLLPVFFFGSLSTFFVALLAAQKRFLIATAVPVVTTVATIVFLVLFASEWGIEALAAGVVVGCIAEAAILAAVAYGAGIGPRIVWSNRTAKIRGVFLQTRHIAVGAALMSGTTLVDQSAAAWLEDGSVATLSYATRLTAVLLTIAASLSTVSLPYFSELVASREWQTLRRTIGKLAGVVICGSVVSVIVIVVFSEPIIALMFERGEFSATDTQHVAWVQVVFILQMPFYILTHIGMRFLFAMEKGSVVIWMSAVIFTVNLLGDILGMQLWGVAGIAFATVISYVVGAVFVLVQIRWLTR